MEWAPNPVMDLPPLADFVKTAIGKFKLSPKNAQFVAVWGDLNCGPLSPCLAFEADAKNYILEPSGLYAFHAGTRLSTAEASAIRNFGSYQAAKQRLATDEALVSLATEGWAIARRVSAPPG
jgi:hypothetical protein